MYADAELALLQAGRKDMSWLREHYDELARTYDQQFVAVQGQNLVASNKSMDGLLDELKRKGVDSATAITLFVTKAAIIL